MLTTLQITSRLHVTPLLGIHHPPFEKLYRDGVYWSLFKEHHDTPLTDRYLLKNVRESLTSVDVDGQHGFWLPTIGFHFGRLHGAILSPETGSPRPNATALVSCTHKDAARGYHVGREWYFIDAQPDEREHMYTDASLLELLQELERDSVTYQEEEATWYYTLCNILGELSGQLFPATSEEYARWEIDRRFWQAKAERTSRCDADTESVDTVPVAEYTS